MAINLSNIIFHYPSNTKKTVLNIPSWTVSTGEQLFLHGPSGSGKSTLLSLLSGLLSAIEGEISVFDQRLDQMNSRQHDRFRANYIGYVFQQFNLISYLNATDNIRLACQFIRNKNVRVKDIEALLHDLGISEDHWQSPARNLSIGQQQRVAIARALITKPQLIIADEPTSSLDQRNCDLFMSLLMKRVSENNTTLIFVSHDLSLAKHFGRIESINDINIVKETV